METNISLAWWLLAALLFTLGVLLAATRFRRFDASFTRLIERLHRGQEGCGQKLRLAQQQLRQQLFHYDTQLASMRLHLSLLDFERQFRQQQQRIGQMHTELRDLVIQMLDELQATRLEIPDAPQWTAAVDALASLPVDQQSEAIRDILAQIQATAVAQQREALREYRWVMGVRNRSLAATRVYWKKMLRRCATLERALRNLDRQLSVVSEGIERYDAHRDKGHKRHQGRVFIHFSLALIALSLGIWLAARGGALFATALQDTGLESALVQQIVSIYGIVLLLLGAIFSSAMRWGALLLPLAELDIRPRRYVAIVSGFALVVACVFGAAPVASPLRETLLEAGWAMPSSYLLSTQLWLLPLLVALQVVVVERLVRVSPPAFWLSGVLLLTALTKGQSLLAQGVSHLVHAECPEDSGRDESVEKSEQELPETRS